MEPHHFYFSLFHPPKKNPRVSGANRTALHGLTTMELSGVYTIKPIVSDGITLPRFLWKSQALFLAHYIFISFLSHQLEDDGEISTSTGIGMVIKGCSKREFSDISYTHVLST